MSRGIAGRRQDSSQPPAEELDSLSAAKDWLRAAPRHLAGLRVEGLGAEQLIDAVARIEDAYDRFPELELEVSRRALVEDLQSSARPVANHTHITLMMAAAVLDSAPSSAAVTSLLSGMARAGDGDAIARAVAILARRRPLACDEIAPALEELCRQGRLAAALAAISEALGHVDVDRAAAEFGVALKRVLATGAGTEVDPAGLTRTILSARNRVQSSIRPQRTNDPGPQLLAVAERVAARLQLRNLSPPPVAATTAPRRTGRLGFAEFAGQWPAIWGVAVEWLPLMTVGSAGERNHAGVCAKPEQAGHLVYGPFVRLGAGDYRVRICWNAGRPLQAIPEGQPVATIEAVSGSGETYLAQRQLRADDYERPEHELLFRIGSEPPPAAPVEVRLWTSGAVPLTVSSITVALVGAPPAPE